MTVTLPDLMRETRNFFPAAAFDGVWTLRSGAISPESSLQPGEWVAITGSCRNNGVFQLNESGCIPGAADETWEGRIWLLAPPADFLALSLRIASWAQTQGTTLAVKESFGAYSRELATGSDGKPLSWQHFFARELAPWRCMYTEVKL